MDGTRVKYIDFYRGIGMLLVIAGHIYTNALFGKMIHVFHVPMWFFISGYLQSSNNRINMTRMIKTCKN